MNNNTKNILFVCTGNVCRSPMAEYIFRTRIGPNQNWNVQSAGIFAMQGAPASEYAIHALAEWDIDLIPHLSQPLTPELVQAAEYILVMTAQHKHEILHHFNNVADRVFLLASFGGDELINDISDPIGLSLETYRSVRDQISASISDLILFLVDRNELQTTSTKPTPTWKIAVGADHGGFHLKEFVKNFLIEHHIEVDDMGCNSTESVDYPDYALQVAKKVSNKEVDQGILVCTTGIGMAITANKVPHVRAALCSNPHMAKMARAHNNANLLALGSSIVSEEETKAILAAWFNSEFDPQDRHARRVKKIDSLDGEEGN